MRELHTYKVIICIEGVNTTPENLWVCTFLGLPSNDEVLATLDRNRVTLEQRAEQQDQGERKLVTEKFANLTCMVQDNGLPASGGEQTCVYCGVPIGRIELRTSELVVEVDGD